MSTDEKIKNFLNTVLGQIEEWLLARKVQQITLVITNVNTKEVLEKWDFRVEYEGNAETDTTNSNGTPAPLPEVGTKDSQTIQKEIREVIRQITGIINGHVNIISLFISILINYFIVLFVVQFVDYYCCI